MPPRSTSAKIRPPWFFVVVFSLLAFSLAQFPGVPGTPPASAPVQASGETPKEGILPSSEAPSPSGPPEGMTIEEWNRTAVVDLTAQPRPARAPKPKPEERRGIFPTAPGVEMVQDDPSAVRVYPLQTLVNHATLVQVPGTVLKAWCGDLQGWTLEGEANYVSVKPLAGDLSTNLHVLTTEGRMYSFRLYSSASGAYTDVFQVKGAAGYQANVASLVDERVADARRELAAEYDRKLQEAVSGAREEWVRGYASQTFFDYAVGQGRSFQVLGAFNDATFTYFRVRGDEKPIVFLESRQGMKWVREALNFNVTGGDFYRVQKLLEPNQRFVLKLRDEEVKIARRGA